MSGWDNVVAEFPERLATFVVIVLIIFVAGALREKP